MKLSRNISILILLLSSIVCQGQDILGQWTTYDNQTKKKKGVVEIYEKNDQYFAKIVKSYDSKSNVVCETCTGSKKGTPIIGLEIIENLKQDGTEYSDGTIMNPENGKTYSCYLKLVSKKTKSKRIPWSISFRKNPILDKERIKTA